jgi:hypothetical protein
MGQYAPRNRSELPFFEARPGSEAPIGVGRRIVTREKKAPGMARHRLRHRVAWQRQLPASAPG